jgi:beta-1,4-N-acetylglucosaminyltransferase
LLGYRPSLTSLTLKNSAKPLNDIFLTIIAGSGGHTTEMLKMIRAAESNDHSFMRRWVLTEGDHRSAEQIRAYEEGRIKRRGSSAGTFELLQIRRARKVHQSWLTVPWTAVMCFVDVLKILISQYPFAEPGSKNQYPHTIITNGPGSGLIFLLVAWTLRILGAIPIDRAHAIYIESFARVKSLSLTGRILHHINIVDLFWVQHEAVAEKYGLKCEPLLSAREA